MDEQELYKDKEPSEGALEFTGTIDDAEIQSDIRIVEEVETSPAIINPQSLISQAIEKNLDVDKLGRLLEMRQELKKEFAKEAFFKALADFQAECPAIEKTKKVFSKNGTLRYCYAPLDSIIAQTKTTIQKFGLSYIIKSKQTDKSVTAICIVHHVAGHEEETEFTVPIDPESFMNAPQKFASALTFSKRYAFCNALGIMTQDQDDDANGVADPEEPKKPQAKQPGKVGVDFEWIGSENQAIFQAIMKLIRESDMPQERKTKIKAGADALKKDLLGLKKLLESTQIYIAGGHNETN